MNMTDVLTGGPHTSGEMRPSLGGPRQTVRVCASPALDAAACFYRSCIQAANPRPHPGKRTWKQILQWQELHSA